MAAPRLRPLPPRGAQRLASWEAELSQGAPRGISRERHAETLDEPRAFDEERPAASQAAAPRLSPRGAPAQYAPFSASERSGLEARQPPGRRSPPPDAAVSFATAPVRRRLEMDESQSRAHGMERGARLSPRAADAPPHVSAAESGGQRPSALAVEEDAREQQHRRSVSRGRNPPAAASESVKVDVRDLVPVRARDAADAAAGAGAGAGAASAARAREATHADEAQHMEYRAASGKERGPADALYVENRVTGEFVKVDANEAEPSGAAGRRNWKGLFRGGEDAASSHRSMEDVADSVGEGAAHVRRTVSVFLLFANGLAAGVALMQLYIIDQRNSDAYFLSYYSVFADGVRTVLYVLLTASFSAVAARCVEESQTPELWMQRSKSARLRLVALAVLSLMAFLCTLASTPLSDRVSFRYTNSRTWFNDASAVAVLAEDLRDFYNLSTARFVGAFLGGILACAEYLHLPTLHPGAK